MMVLNIPWMCSLHWNVYFTIQNVSNLDCACLCTIKGPCTKYGWNSVNGECILHSEDEPKLFSELPVNLLWFGRYPAFHGPCTKYGWDSVNRDCVLHSEEQPGLFLEISQNLVWFGMYPTFNVCQSVGYDYDYYTHTCIRLVDTTSSPLTWTSARTRCQVEGGDLISLTTKKKVDFVLNYLNCLGDINAWIGFRRKTWMTGEPLDVSIFESHQINNYDGHYPNETDSTCGKLRPWSSNDIQDESCNMKLKNYFICEIIV